MTFQISFHGGVDTITGSCHLLTVGGLNILIDCGLFQGPPHWEKKNHDDFGFDPASVDYLLLTHGHLDHCGRIPLLVKKGFQGKIICTSGTYDIAKVVIMDSARIQEEDYEYWKKINPRRSFVRKGPLYTTEDALESLGFFSKLTSYETPVRLNSHVRVTFRDAGHIFGAAFLEIDMKGMGRITFSGDLGNRNKPIIRDPVLPRKSDVVIIEGTYADRNHKDINDSVHEFKGAISDAFRRRGNVLIPSFAIERAQELLYYLREFHEQKLLPSSCRVFLDTPMGISVTNIMRRHPEYFDKEARRLIQQRKDPFSFRGVEFTRTQVASKQINKVKGHGIIIAGSGMCTGGRIKHHLRHNISKKQTSIIFVGYQAQGTLGRKIVDGEKRVRIFGHVHRVKASVYTIGGFSAHADRDILLQWLEESKKPQHVFLVHGENRARKSFATELKKRNTAEQVHIPRFHEQFTL